LSSSGTDRPRFWQTGLQALEPLARLSFGGIAKIPAFYDIRDAESVYQLVSGIKHGSRQI